MLAKLLIPLHQPGGGQIADLLLSTTRCLMPLGNFAE
jgi:hypothetical protein